MKFVLKTVAAAAALAILLIPATAIAHHGWSGYTDAPQRVTGVIRAVEFANPHVTIRLEAQDRVWLVVLAPPSRMTNQGLTQASFNVGETATVEGYVHRANQNEMRAEWIALRDVQTRLR